MNREEDTMKENPVHYRLESLILAVDFFTQRFSQEQLVEFSFEFVNEILTLNESALFVREGNQFVLRKKRLYTFEEYSIDATETLASIVTLHGNCLWSNFNTYLGQQIIDDFNLRLLIPLMIDSHLYGFIVSSGKIIGDIQHDDQIIASTLMRLINNSMENSKHFADLQQSNALLDQKIFNLFTINQSSKALLSELNLSRLHTLATDVFSEISTSQVTSFGMYDEHSGRIRIVGYRNVTSFNSFYTELELKESTYHGHIVLNVDKDIDVLRAHFVDIEPFYRLESQYIVLIVGNGKIMGLVTLGASAQGRPYDEALFELIESLATSTYIAINNGMLFEELNREKKSTQNKLDMLINLNKLTKNIKHCTTIEDLSYLTLQTLKFAFGISKALIAFRREGQLEVIHQIGLPESVIGKGSLPPQLLQACQSIDMRYGFSQESILEFLGEPLPEHWGESNGFVMSPFSFSNNRHVTEDAEVEIDGFLLVLETEAQLKEEEILLVESIASSISPVAHHIQSASLLKQRYIPDPLQQFVEALAAKINEFETDQVPFYAYCGPYAKHPFERFEAPQELSHLEVFYIDGYLFVLSYSPLNVSYLQRLQDQFDVTALLEQYN